MKRSISVAVWLLAIVGLGASGPSLGQTQSCFARGVLSAENGLTNPASENFIGSSIVTCNDIAVVAISNGDAYEVSVSGTATSSLTDGELPGSPPTSLIPTALSVNTEFPGATVVTSLRHSFGVTHNAVVPPASSSFIGAGGVSRAQLLIQNTSSHDVNIFVQYHGQGSTTISAPVGARVYAGVSAGFFLAEVDGTIVQPVVTATGSYFHTPEGVATAGMFDGSVVVEAETANLDAARVLPLISVPAFGNWSGVMIQNVGGSGEATGPNVTIQYFSPSTHTFTLMADGPGVIFSLAPVPEPSALAMLLAGLGLIAWRTWPKRSCRNDRRLRP